MSFDWGAQAASLQLPADWRIKGAKSMETAKNFFQHEFASPIQMILTLASLSVGRGYLSCFARLQTTLLCLALTFNTCRVTMRHS